MTFVIFYSWQSDLPNRTNRGLIGDALENAATALQRDETVSVEPVVDRDTAGTPGAPDIALTIFGKIDRCQLFVGDVSLVNPNADDRRTPNPNVLVELGYALKALGPERVVLVMNTAFGGPELLPFDLRMRRVRAYNSPPEAVERAAERRRLERALDVAIRSVIEHHVQVAPPTAPPEPSPFERAVEAVDGGRPQQAALVSGYMADLAKRLDELAPDFGAAEKTDVPLDEALVVALDRTADIVEEFAGLARIVGTSDAHGAARALYEGFGYVMKGYFPRPPVAGQGTVSFRDIDFDFLKFLGHELFVTLFAALISNRRWATVGDLLADPIYIERGRHGEPQAVSFVDVSQPVRLLDYRNDRLQSRRVSVHADLLNARHSSGSLAEITPASVFIEADYFLWLRSVAASETVSDGRWWLGYSVLYLHTRTPRYFLEAERLSRAEALARALGVEDIDRLRSLVRERAGWAVRLFDSAYDLMPLHGFIAETMGSKA